MRRAAERDSGFTLVELLVVIVILGVLSTVTVFAVRGITDEGGESACAGDYATIVRAQEAHDAFYGGYADAPTLVSADLLVAQPTLFEVTGDADGYSVSPAADSGCTQSGGVTPPAPPAVNPPTAPGPATDPAPSGASYINYVTGTVSYTNDAWQYWDPSLPSKPHSEVVVFGRGEAAAAYADMVAAGPLSTRRITLIDLDDVTNSFEIGNAMSRARSTPPQAFVLFLGDDTTPLVDTSDSVDAYLTLATGGDPYHPLPPGGDLLALVESYN